MKKTIFLFLGAVIIVAVEAWVGLGPSNFQGRRIVSSNYKHGYPRTRSVSLNDRSAATRFDLGDKVEVVSDVLKNKTNLKGMEGIVVETWEKCDVDPTCCCAEWVDKSFSVRVQFNAGDSELIASDQFFYYFAEEELMKTS